MGLSINCYICKSKLKEKGGLYFSPPQKSGFYLETDLVTKVHFCKECSEDLEVWIENARK